VTTPAELCAKWSARLVEWRSLGVQASGEKVAAEILDDLRALQSEDLVTLGEASRLGGYSVDHLQRLVRQGTIENVGRKHAPRLRRQDVPTKPGRSVAALPSTSPSDQLSARRRIVADAQTRKGA
jgi:hypothetical protein